MKREKKKERNEKEEREVMAMIWNNKIVMKNEEKRNWYGINNNY